MANIDLGNLTRYDGKIKEYAEDKYLSKNTANWQMTEKAEVVTCYPVPDTELEPIVDFSFKEISPASGEKSPSNPSTITGISSVKVIECGKNLLPFPYTSIGGTNNGITWVVNDDGSITVNGTATADSSFSITSIGNNIVKDGITYTISGCPSGGSTSTYCIRFGNSADLSDVGNGKTFVANSDTVGKSVWLKIGSGTTVSNLVFRPQLELGTIVTTFEPYSGADYIANIENTYYGGSVNLATGLMTVTWVGVSLTGVTEDNINISYNFSDRTGSYTYNWAAIYINGIFNTYIRDTSVSPVCTHCPCYENIQSNDIHGFVNINSSIGMGTAETSKSDFTTWLATQYANGTPVTFVWKIIPVTTQLTPIQIKSLFALDKNTPRLNTLYTDADSIQVGYQKHPARTAYELENAILALGGGE